LKASDFLILAGSSASIFRFFRRLGAFGLILLSALDSSFLVLPFGNDLLLIGLISADRKGWSWIVYVLTSAAGSVLGVLLLDLPMRKTGEKGLERFVSRRRIERLKHQIENKAAITVLLATLMPPPFPFTPVVMTASALQCSRKTLLLSVFVGRLIRFTIEAILALYLGRKLIGYINSEVFAYFVYGLMAVAVVASVFSAVKWRNKRTSKKSGMVQGTR
jgi:membrane protein YqaA with SNARE-associated domain